MKKLSIKKGDIIIIAAVLCISALLFLCINIFSSGGSYANIEVNGSIVAALPLGSDTIYDVEIDGRVTNVVEIKNGYASVISADCPDKICVNHRSISKRGESIICLPNKVIVTVESNSSKEEVDGVAG